MSDITASTMARLLARAETAEAHAERALDCLAAVMRTVPSIEFAKPETQSARAAARALLVEVGR